MAILTAYFDAGGSPDDPKVDVLSVAGFVATENQWKLFEKSWKSALSKYEVTSLHMKEFAHSTGQFKTWKGDEKKRRAFLTLLISIIKKRVRHSFAASVYLPAYREIDTNSHIREVLSPLALAGCSSIIKVKKWAESNNIELKNIHFVFEDGDTDKANLIAAANRDCQINPSFLPKDEALPCQAADLLAYEHMKANTKIVPESGIYGLEDLRHPLQSLAAIPNGASASDWVIMEGQEITATLQSIFRILGKPWVG